MNANEKLKKTAEGLAQSVGFYHCPVTGQIIINALHDDKAICDCPAARKTLGVHRVAELVPAPALAYVRAMLVKAKKQEREQRMKKAVRLSLVRKP